MYAYLPVLANSLFTKRLEKNDLQKKLIFLASMQEKSPTTNILDPVRFGDDYALYNTPHIPGISYTLLSTDASVLRVFVIFDPIRIGDNFCIQFNRHIRCALTHNHKAAALACPCHSNGVLCSGKMDI